MKKVFRVLAVLVLFNVAFSIDLTSAVIGYAVGSSDDNSTPTPKPELIEMVCSIDEEVGILVISIYAPLHGEGVWYDTEEGKVSIKTAIPGTHNSCSGTNFRNTSYTVTEYINLKVKGKKVVSYKVSLSDGSFKIQYKYKR